ncbi:hypothetical protein chiPu_0019880 [Chiloscyllium punctatum]|uniref:Ig-like domain-containing protein n=1 Tax=Chiloscyllium punctatum TaxID=137246 RepID=A0A401RTF7_CHIPU|nr:hypothetical protein [Chiloscyllium punctatum]
MKAQEEEEEEEEVVRGKEEEEREREKERKGERERRGDLERLRQHGKIPLSPSENRGFSTAIQVTIPDPFQTAILFQPVVLKCRYDTTSLQPPIVLWKYRSFCRDRILDAFNPSSSENQVNDQLQQADPNYNPYVNCPDSSRTVRTVASKHGKAVTLDSYYQGRKITIINEADLSIEQTAWGDSGVYYCTVTASDDLSGNNEGYVELLVLVRSGYRIQANQHNDDMRVLYYVEKELAHFDPKSPGDGSSKYENTSAMSEVSSLHEDHDTRNNLHSNIGRVRMQAMPPIRDIDEESAVSSVSRQTPRRDYSWHDDDRVYRGSHQRARSMESLDDIGRRDRDYPRGRQEFDRSRGRRESDSETSSRGYAHDRRRRDYSPEYRHGEYRKRSRSRDDLMELERSRDYATGGYHDSFLDDVLRKKRGAGRDVDSSSGSTARSRARRDADLPQPPPYTETESVSSRGRNEKKLRKNDAVSRESLPRTFIGPRGSRARRGPLSELSGRSVLRAGALLVAQARPGDSGLYVCKAGATTLAQYRVDVQDAERLHVSHRGLGQAPLRNQSVRLQQEAGHGHGHGAGGCRLRLYTRWGPWQECDRCGAPGERKRLGFCWASLQEDEDEEDREEGEGRAEEEPCGLMQLRLGQVLPHRGPEIRYEICRRECGSSGPEELAAQARELLGSGYFLQRDQGLGLGQAGRGDLRVPPTWLQPRSLLLETLLLDVHEEVRLQCPGASVYTPVSWQRDSGMLTRLELLRSPCNGSHQLDRKTGGGVYTIAGVRRSDQGVYRCWVRGRRAAAFHLELPEPPSSFHDGTGSRQHRLQSRRLLGVLRAVIGSFALVFVLSALAELLHSCWCEVL